jgi:hypothetical protein
LKYKTADYDDTCDTLAPEYFSNDKPEPEKLIPHQLGVSQSSIGAGHNFYRCPQKFSIGTVILSILILQ